MKNYIGAIFLIALSYLAHDTTAQNFERTALGLEGSSQKMNIRVEFYSSRIVRVFKTPEGKPYEKSSLAVVKKPETVKLTYGQTGDLLTVASGDIVVGLNPETGGIHFSTTTGEQLLLDKDYGTQFTPIDDFGTPSFKVRQAFLLDNEEPVYGVGQVMDNRFNRRNSTHHMQNENMFTYSPYFMSIKGYAVYWDNYSISDFNDNPQELSFEGLGHCDDYYFVLGGDADGVIAQMRDLTGKAPMLPLWAYGFFQSKERYHKQDESVSVLKKYRELQVPIDVMIQDWRYWPQYQGTDSAWNSQSFDKLRFPDPQAWAKQIHDLNAKLLIVTWPGFGPKTAQRRELDSLHMILDFDTWPPNNGIRPYDVYNPQARDIYWKYLNKGLFSYIHNDGWWLDSTEPDHFNRKDSDYGLPTFLGSYRSVKNTYSMMHNQGIATHQKEFSKDKRVVILTRSGFIGQQRFGSNTWSGDVMSSWEMLEKQIPAALNFTLMGIPNWNSDIGGFFAWKWRDNGGNQNPEFMELYVRWMQFGTFCPMMRSHGTDLPREIWNFGERGTWCFDAQEKMINLRYSLLPYIYSTSWDVSHNDGTFMRPLIMDFSDDKNTHDLGSQYLFGRSILVAPVTQYQATVWDVYLPAGSSWYNFWTNEKLEGAQNISANAPIDQVPLFVKAGSIIPIGPRVQYSTEKKWDQLEIKVYPGADGTFTLYEDELDNYNYEKGAFTTIKFIWNEAEKKLTVEDREGKYPGMLAKRSFRISLLDGANGSKEIKYSGKKIVVQF